MISDQVPALSAVTDPIQARAALGMIHPDFSGVRLRRLAVVGAIGEGRRLVEACTRLGIDVVAIADDASARQGASIGNLKVEQVESLMSLDREVPVIIASHRGAAVRRRLKAVGFRHVELFALLQVLRPEDFPAHPFYASWFESLWDARDNLIRLADRLSDDWSRRVLDAVIRFRQSVDPDTLTPVVEWDLYESPGLITYGDDEVYVDGGAFDGDTIDLFLKRVGNRFERVLGFEPDPATYAKLAAKFVADPRIDAINAGLWSETTTLRFQAEATQGSALTQEGGQSVQVTSIDDALGNAKATFIKMNIEGAELRALEGARHTIAKWKPRLAVSAYHNPSDLWEVAEAIDRIRPDYRLFLRQHDEATVETVLYALP